MGYRNLEERRSNRLIQLRVRRRRRWMASLTLLLLITYTVIALRLLTDVFRPTAPVSMPPGAVAVAFGKGRDTATRTAVVPWKASSASSAGQAITVHLDSDLANDDSSAQFPAHQVTISGNQISTTSVALSISANPWVPERVPAGTYDSVLIVTDGSTTRSIPFVIVLPARGGQWATLAFLLLFTGAGLGLTVKWITERLTPQAMTYRRLAALRRAIGWGDDGRSVALEDRLAMEELGDLIARQEHGKAEQLFGQLESRRAEVAIRTSQFSVLYDQLDAQAEAIGSVQNKLKLEDLARVDAALDEEYRCLMVAQSASQQLDISGQPCEALDPKALRDHFIVASQVIAEYLARPDDEHLLQAVDSLRSGDYATAKESYNQCSKETPSAPAKNDFRRPVETLFAFRSARGQGQAADVSLHFRLARPIAGVASVLVVSLVGLKSQYLDQPSFTGDLSAWLALGLWGLVVELSGVSVVDVLSRLSGPTGVGSTPANTSPTTRV
jgi:hypothetical protein